MSEVEDMIREVDEVSLWIHICALNMYMYIYLYLYVYNYCDGTHKYLPKYIYSNIYVYTYMYICMYIYIHICTYISEMDEVCLYIHMYALNIYICMHIWMYVFIHTLRHNCIHVRACLLSTVNRR